MRRAGRVDDQRLSVADVCQVREQFDVADQLLARLQATLDTEAEDGAKAVGMILRRQLVLGMALQTRVAHPVDRGMSFQELGDVQRVLAVPLHAQRQRLQPLQEEPAIQGSYRGSQVTQKLHARLDDVGQWTKGLDKAQAVVRGIGLDQPGKPSIRPVELAAIHDHAADGRAVTTDELGRRVDDDIASMLEGLHEIWGGQRVIQDQWHAMLVCDIGHGANIERIQARIAHSFCEYGLCAFVKSGVEVLWIAAIYETYVYPQLWQRIVEEVICASIQ